MEEREWVCVRLARPVKGRGAAGVGAAVGWAPGVEDGAALRAMLLATGDGILDAEGTRDWRRWA